jgi:hypothetical protein
MYIIIGPAGSNINYISQVLTDTELSLMLSYHYNTNGSHSLKKIKNWPVRIVTPPSKNYKSYIGTNNLSIQIIIENEKKFLLLNWFEKHSRSQLHDTPWFNDWCKIQLKSWEPVIENKETRLIRGVVRWYYSLQDKNHPDMIDLKEIENKFYFDKFYSNNYELIAQEFAKYNKDYTSQMFKNWRESQKIIFDSMDSIIENLNSPNKLKLFWQKGLAMALYGFQNNLNEQQTWKYFN